MEAYTVLVYAAHKAKSRGKKVKYYKIIISDFLSQFTVFCFAVEMKQKKMYDLQTKAFLFVLY